MAEAPLVTLNNGQKMPALGLGTWLAKPGEVGNAVKVAINLGYRHFDCALLYSNEKEIGAALREKINNETVKRQELFVVSKLWNTYHSPDLVVKGCKKSLKNLGLDYIDLYLMHWPIAFKPTEKSDEESAEHTTWDAILKDPEYFPKDDKGNLILSDDDILSTWKEMEKCVQLGLTKSIGISNFNSEQIYKIVQNARIKPVVNQIEAHVYFNQKKLIEVCKKHNLMSIAFSPLGSSGRPWLHSNQPTLLQNPSLIELSRELKRTPGQVALRYLVENGVVFIPKSTNPHRLKDNISIFDFKLTQKQVQLLDSLNINDRTCLLPGAEFHKEYPFNIEYYEGRS